MTHVEVRCCCRPTELLGWLPVDARITIAPGVRARWPLAPERRPDVGTEIATQGFTVLELELARWIQQFPAEGDVINGIAFRSDDTPLTVLRRVVGFIERSGTHDGQETESQGSPDQQGKPEGGAGEEVAHRDPKEGAYFEGREQVR